VSGWKPFTSPHFLLIINPSIPTGSVCPPAINSSIEQSVLLVIPNNYRGHNVLVGGLTWERRIQHIGRNWNLVPFRGIAEQIGSILDGEAVTRNFVYLAGNLIGFSPLGFFLPVLFPKQRKFKAFTITVVSALACLEFAQLITMRGSFDIDDIILNTSGACLGFWILMHLDLPIVDGQWR
jgi:hypothetical protein